MTSSLHLREFQNFGRDRFFGRRDDGRTGLARHHISPGFQIVPNGTGEEPYCTNSLRQRKVAGISSSGFGHSKCVQFAPELQPNGVGWVLSGPLNAAVASGPNVLSGFSRQASRLPAHPSPRSRSSFSHLSSPREGCTPRHPCLASFAVSAFRSSTPKSPEVGLADVLNDANVERRLQGTTRCGVSS